MSDDRTPFGRALSQLVIEHREGGVLPFEIIGALVDVAAQAIDDGWWTVDDFRRLEEDFADLQKAFEASRLNERGPPAL